MIPRPLTGPLSRYWDRSPRRQQLAKPLHRCGPLMVLQALNQVAAGGDLDETLEACCGLQPADYQAAGADRLPIDRLDVVTGGRK